MVFSWKQAKKDSIKKLRSRVIQYNKNGRNDVAKLLQRRIERLEKNG